MTNTSRPYLTLAEYDERRLPHLYVVGEENKNVVILREDDYLRLEATARLAVNRTSQSEDAKLLDFLEGEANREHEWYGAGNTDTLDSIFRRNLPITRNTIRIAMRASAALTPSGEPT